MDLQATAQLLGNFGEFFGAIAVVITLGYLAVQVRQNTRMLKTSIYNSWVDTASKTHSFLSQNADVYAEIYGNSKELRDLELPEFLKYHAHWQHMMNSYEAFYLSYLEGAVGESVFESKHRNMVEFLSQSLHRASWVQNAEVTFDRRFIQYVEKRVLPEAKVHRTALRER